MKKDKAQKGKPKKKSFLRHLRWGTLFPALAMTLFGVLLFALPKDSMQPLSIATGALFSALALLFIAGAFFSDRAGILQLGCAVVLIAFSVWLFVQPGEAVSVLLLVLTGIIFLRALLGLWFSLSVKKRGGRLWQAVFAGSLVLALCAFTLFFIPIVSKEWQIVLLGALSLLDGGMELFSLFHRLFSGGAKAKESDKTKEPDKTKKPDKAQEADEPKEPEKGKRSADEPEPQAGPEPPKEERPKRFSFRKKDKNPTEPSEGPAPSEEPEPQTEPEPPKEERPKRFSFRKKKGKKEGE